MIKKVNIPFGEKSVIHGDLHMNKNSRKLVILCHGFKDSKDSPSIKRLAGILGKKFNVYRFTFTDRENPFLPEEADNISLVLEKFRPLYKEIIIVGASLGGLSVFLNIPKNPMVDRLILINPFIFLFKRVNWKFTKMIIGLLLLYPFSIKVRENINYYFKKLRPELVKIPTLVLTAKNDKIVSPVHGQVIYNQIKSTNKKIIMDDIVDHGLTKDYYRQRISKYVINWISK